MNADRLFQMLANLQSKELKPFVVQRDEEFGAWWHVRDAVPPVLLEELTHFSDREANEYYLIHSKRVGDLSRIVLTASPGHVAQMKTHGETDVISSRPEAKTLSAELASVYASLTGITGTKCGILEEPELLRSIPGSLGSMPHMDSCREPEHEGEDHMAAIINLSPDSIVQATTALAKYPWQPCPVNLGPDSKVPLDWSKIETVKLAWKWGDIIVFYQTLIHWTAANLTKFHREICFMGGRPTNFHGSSWSDTIVITQDVFHDMRRYTSHTL
jgi:hypothetical protein